MADTTQQPTDATSQQSAQQALDDLTVLSNVQTQSLGDTRLNVARAVDVSDGGMGSLAMVHQGSTSAPSVQNLAQAATGVAQHADIVVDQASGGVQIAAVDNLQLAPSTPFENPQWVDAGVVVQHLPDLAAPTEIFGTPAAPVEQVQVSGPTGVVAQGVTQASVTSTTITTDTTVTNNAPNLGGVFKIQTVDPANGSPGGVDPSKLTTGEDGTIKFGVIASDPDGDPLTINVGSGQHGTVTKVDGQWVYTPDSDYNGVDSFVVSVDDGHGHVVSETITVNIDAVTDGATISFNGNVVAASDGTAVTDANPAATGTEDTAMTFSLNVTDTHGAGYAIGNGQEVITSVDVSGAPAGSTLTIDGQTVTADANGVFHLTTEQANGQITVNTPTDWNGDFTLKVDAVAVDGSATPVTTEASLSFHVDAVTDGATITAPTTTVTGTEDHATTFTLGVADTHGAQYGHGETVNEVQISGAPAGSTLTVDGQTITADSNGVFHLSADQANGQIAVNTPTDWNGDFTLKVDAVAQDGTATPVTTEADLSFHIDAVSDGATITAPTTTVTGTEDHATTFTLGVADTHGAQYGHGETVNEVQISGAPAGSTLTVDGQTITADSNGVFHLSADQANGQIAVNTPTDWNGDFTLKVDAVAQDGTATPVTTEANLSFHIDAVTDGATIATPTTTVHGTEDQATTVHLGVTDGHFNEHVDSVTVSGAPAGSTLTIDGQTVTADASGVFHLTPDQAAGDIQVNTPKDWNGSFDLKVDAVAQDGTVTPVTTESTVHVEVGSVTDGATIATPATVHGTEDSATTAHIGVTDSHFNEHVDSVTVSGAPAGSTLTIDGQTVTADASGVFHLTPDQAAGDIQVNTPKDWNGSFDLKVDAIAHDGTATPMTTESTVHVDVAAVNDGPVADSGHALQGTVEDTGEKFSVVSVDNGHGGSDLYLEGANGQQIHIASDVDSHLSVSNLSADHGSFTQNADGSWNFTPEHNFDGSVNVTATVSDGQATTTSTATIEVTAKADDVSFSDHSVGSFDHMGDSKSGTSGSGKSGGGHSQAAQTSTSGGGHSGAGHTGDGHSAGGHSGGGHSGAGHTGDGHSGGGHSGGGHSKAGHSGGGSGDTSGSADHYTAQLHISASTSDEVGHGTYGSETMSYSVGGLPDHVSLVDASGHALDPSHLTDAQVQAGVYISIPAGEVPPTFDLTVTATSTEASNGDTSFASSEIHVDTSSLLASETDTSHEHDHEHDSEHYNNGIGNGPDGGTPGNAPEHDEGSFTTDHSGSESHDQVVSGGEHHDAMNVSVTMGNDHTSSVTHNTGEAGTHTLTFDESWKGNSNHGVHVLVDGQDVGTLSGAHDSVQVNLTGNDTISFQTDSGNVTVSNIQVDGVHVGGSDKLTGHDQYDVQVGGETTVTTHTQTMHVDLTGNEGEAGGLQLSGFHAGDSVTANGNTWTADGDGAITISGNQLDSMTQNGEVHQDFTVTSQEGAVGSVGVTEMTQQAGGEFQGGSAGESILAGTGNDVIHGGDGSDTFLFDFGTGHDTVDGGQGNNWTDTIDLHLLGNDVSVTVQMDGHDAQTHNHSDWVATADSSGHTNVGHDQSGTITIHHADGNDDHIAFQNVEQIKW